MSASVIAAIARRRWFAFFARALFKQSALTVDGETAHATSERVDRLFC